MLGIAEGVGDVTAWVVWFLNALREAIGVAVNDRQTKVVTRMLAAGPGGFEGGLSRRKYVAMTRTSPATAQRELADLVQKGVLVALPGGGRSTAYALRW